MSSGRKAVLEKLCKHFAKVLNVLTMTLLGGWLFVVIVAIIPSWIIFLTGCCAFV